MNMKKTGLFILLALLLLVLAGCGQPSVDEAKADFCQDLGAFGTSVGALGSIDITSSKDELQDTISGVESSLSDLVDSVKTLKDVDVDAVQGIISDLKDSVGEVSDQGILEGDLAEIKGAALNALAEIQEIFNTTCNSYAQE